MKYICAVALSAVMMTLLCGCNNSDSSADDYTGKAVVDDGRQSVDRIKEQDYVFPTFMNKLHSLNDVDELTNVSYASFESSMVAEVKNQPFEDFECLLTYGGMYIYQDGDYQGLLDFDGSALILADEYAKMEFVSPTMIKLYMYDTENSEYNYGLIENVNGKRSFEVIKDYKYRSSQISVVNNTTEDSDVVSYSIKIGDTVINNASWDSVEEIDISQMNTDKKCKVAYRVSKDYANYVVTIDEYYNYVIYEGLYSSISLRVGTNTGNCYILSYDDNEEVQTLINSFNKTVVDDTVASDDSVIGDDTSDYITLTFGGNTDEIVTITVYSNGSYVETLEITEDKAINSDENLLMSDNTAVAGSYSEKYMVDKTAFVDLMRWVDLTVSKEYE